jgi:hypothetical protein
MSTPELAPSLHACCFSSKGKRCLSNGCLPTSSRNTVQLRTAPAGQSCVSGAGGERTALECGPAALGELQLSQRDGRRRRRVRIVDLRNGKDRPDAAQHVSGVGPRLLQGVCSAPAMSAWEWRSAAQLSGSEPGSAAAEQPEVKQAARERRWRLPSDRTQHAAPHVWHWSCSQLFTRRSLWLAQVPVSGSRACEGGPKGPDAGCMQCGAAPAAVWRRRSYRPERLVPAACRSCRPASTARSPPALCEAERLMAVPPPCGCGACGTARALHPRAGACPDAARRVRRCVGV